MFWKMLPMVALLASGPAYAHDWYVINNNTAQCESLHRIGEIFGFSDVYNPATLKSHFESLGDLVSDQEKKKGNGTLVEVEMTVQVVNGGGTADLIFYPSAHICDVALSIGKKNGDVVDPGDMK